MNHLGQPGLPGCLHLYPSVTGGGSAEADVFDVDEAVDDGEYGEAGL